MITTIPAVLCNHPDDVAEVTALPGFRLHVRFNDGVEGDVDMDSFIHSSTAGVFAQLADPDRFAQAYSEYGAVTWPDELDLAPDAMYIKLKKTGQWTLESKR